jgi:hypothetical protein
MYIQAQVYRCGNGEEVSEILAKLNSVKCWLQLQGSYSVKTCSCQSTAEDFLQIIDNSIIIFLRKKGVEGL